jgi:hypothetical protein
MDRSPIYAPKNLGETSYTSPLFIRMIKCRAYTKVKNESMDKYAYIHSMVPE